MRRLIAFACAGETLVGTLDHAPGETGLLIVSGGNEIRAGAHRGMAMLAAQVAAAGHPVFRFDRRGVGDSSGNNSGFRASGPDIAAAAASFRQHVGLARIVGFGNCDAASALALFGRAAGVDALLLANPWVVEPAGDLPPPAAIRARYAARLRDPAAWRRLLSGGVSITKAARGLARIATTDRGEKADLVKAIAGWPEARVILARDDATAIAFADSARHGHIPPIAILDTASHSFADAADALAAEVIAGLIRSSTKKTDKGGS